MSKNIKLSVVVPAYNEAKRIENTLQYTIDYLEKQTYGFEIVVIDNGSKDDTFAIVKKFTDKYEHHIRVVQAREKGKGGAVKFGIMTQATGEYIMFMDADNASPISEIEKFWQYFETGFSVVIGSRYLKDSHVTRKQPFYRIVLSRMSNLLIQLLAVPGIKDTQLGFKAFTHDAAKKIFDRITIFGWGFDMEVLTIARLYKFKIKEVPVLWREQGGSHVPLAAYLRSLLDLFKIKLNVILGKYSK